MTAGHKSLDGFDKELFGSLPDGREVHLYTLRSAGQVVRFTDFGARLVSLHTPDRQGLQADVVLGYGAFASYLRDRKTYFGASIGRYANRLAGGTFPLDGQIYRIPLNNGNNALHGGPEGFDRQLWQSSETADGVQFTLRSPNGDQGFPGALNATVRYSFHAGRLQIDYHATTDAPTVVNLTNHTYFNLAGESSGSILDHVLELPADRFTPVDAEQIPTGELEPVAGTPFDFRKPARIGERIGEDNVQLKRGSGYDHNWVLGEAGQKKLAARVWEPKSGRRLTVETTQPGIQFYSGNQLDGSFPNRTGGVYGKHAGLCLETQHFPDSPNHPAFPSTVLRPGEVFESTTIFTFTIQNN